MPLFVLFFVRRVGWVGRLTLKHNANSSDGNSSRKIRFFFLSLIVIAVAFSAVDT